MSICFFTSDSKNNPVDKQNELVHQRKELCENISTSWNGAKGEKCKLMDIIFEQKNF